MPAACSHELAAANAREEHDRLGDVDCGRDTEDGRERPGRVEDLPGQQVGEDSDEDANRVGEPEDLADRTRRDVREVRVVPEAAEAARFFEARAGWTKRTATRDERKERVRGARGE